MIIYRHLAVHQEGQEGVTLLDKSVIFFEVIKHLSKQDIYNFVKIENNGNCWLYHI